MVDPISPNSIGPLPSEPPPSDMGSPRGNPPPTAAPPADEPASQTAGGSQAASSEAPPPDPEAGSLERQAALTLAARKLPANEASARALAMLARRAGVGVDRAADALILGVRLGMPPTMAQLGGLAGSLAGASSFGEPLRDALGALSELIRVEQGTTPQSETSARASPLLAAAARVRANLSSLLPKLDSSRGLVSFPSPVAAAADTLPAPANPAPGQTPAPAVGQAAATPPPPSVPGSAAVLPPPPLPATSTAGTPTASPPPAPDLLGGTLTALIELEKAGLDHIRSLASLERLEQVLQALRSPPSLRTGNARGGTTLTQHGSATAATATGSQLPPFAIGTAIALEALVQTGSLTPPEMAATSQSTTDGFHSTLSQLVEPLDNDQRAAMLERLANLETRLLSEDPTLMRLRRAYSGLRTVSERMVSLHTATQLSRDGDPPLLTILPVRVDGGAPRSILVKVEHRRRGQGERDKDGGDGPAPLCKVDLETPHLGPVEVSLDLPKERVVDVGFTVNTGAVARLFTRHLGELNQRLRRQGVRAVQSRVSVRTTPKPSPPGTPAAATDHGAEPEEAPWPVSGLVLDLLGGEPLPPPTANPQPVDLEG